MGVRSVIAGRPMKSSLIPALLIVLSGALPTVAGTLPLPLEPLAAKYSQDRQALEEARVRQVEALRARYGAALAGARVEALKSNKGGALVAIDAEIAGLKSDVHLPAAPPDLP